MQQYYNIAAAKCRKLANCNGIIWLHGSLFALALAAQCSDATTTTRVTQKQFTVGTH